MHLSLHSKLISLGALIALTGYVMSGPVAFTIVNLISPQPPWGSAAVFARNYSTIQDLPFYFGFLLVAGMLILVAGHYFSYQKHDETRFLLLISFSFIIIFCGLISFNYIAQTTFVHNLALHYKPQFDSAISSFSMSNPLSFCWAAEMWGYAILGISTWFMASYYKNNSMIRLLLIVNGIVSLLSAVWSIIDIGWIMTRIGLVSYFAWNALMITLMILIYRHSKRLSKKALSEKYTSNRETNENESHKYTHAHR